MPKSPSAGRTTNSRRSRRARIWFAALAVATLSVSTMSPAAAAPAPSPRTSLAYHAWGVDAFSVSPAQVASYEANVIKRNFASYAVYAELNEGGQTFVSDPKAQHAISTNGYLYLNINSSYINSEQVETAACWSAIANGLWDTQINRWAQTFRAWSYSKLIIGFQHEQNIGNDGQQPRCDNDTASTYRDAYKHFYHQLHDTDKGNVNALFAWVPTASAFFSSAPVGDRAQDYEPDPHNFDVIGVDAYSNKDNWRSPSTLLDPFFTWAANTDQVSDKLLMIGEIGAYEGNKGMTFWQQRARDWYADAIVRIQQANLLAVNWNIVEGDEIQADRYFSPTLNLLTLRVWCQGAHSAFFRAQPPTQPPTPIGQPEEPACND